MTLTKQDLNAIQDVVDSRLDLKLAPIHKDLVVVKEDVRGLKQDVSGLKRDIEELKEDVAEIPVLHKDVLELKSEVNSLRQEVQRLTISIDKLIKMYEDQKEEFVILKKEMDQIKEFLFEKFGVKIAVQR